MFGCRYNRNEATERVGLSDSIDLILHELMTNGPYDILLGFSQGGGMVTRIVAKLLQDLPPDKRLSDVLKCVVLVGGTPPGEDESCAALRPLPIPSLHIIGAEDSYLPQLEQLVTWYDPSQAKVCRHSEGHNIPSIRTELYPEINAYIHQVLASARPIVLEDDDDDTSDMKTK